MSFLSNLSTFLVADDRIEGSNDTDTVLYHLVAALLVDGDAEDTLRSQSLDMQYLLDMSQLVDQIGRGEAAQEPYSTFMGLLDTNFKYGTAIVTWNKAQAAAYAEELGN